MLMYERSVWLPKVSLMENSPRFTHFLNESLCRSPAVQTIFVKGLFDACNKCASPWVKFFESQRSPSPYHQTWLWKLSGGFPRWSQQHWWTTVIFPGWWHSRPLCCAGPKLRLQSGSRSLMWGARRAVWVFGQELGQTGAECDGVITLLAALLSALAWMPLFIHPKRHIIGPRRVGYPGHWPQSRGQGEQGGRWKGA